MFRPLFLNGHASNLNVYISIPKCPGLYFWMLWSLFLNFHVSISEYSYIYFWMFKFPPEKCSLFRPLFLNVQASILKCSGLYSSFSGLYLWIFRSLFLIVQVSIHEFSGLYSWLFRSLFLNIQSSVPVCLSPLFLIVEWMFRSLSDWELSPLLFRSLLLNFQVSIPDCSGLYFSLFRFLFQNVLVYIF